MNPEKRTHNNNNKRAGFMRRAPGKIRAPREGVHIFSYESGF
jgi:hypothetical protein